MRKLIHVLLPGQELSVRFREARGQVLKNLQTMRLTPDGGNPDARAYVTFVDETGVSLYITRGYLHGGDVEAFLPKDTVMWQSYFDAVDSSCMGYALSKHFTRRFPLDFI